MGDAAYHLRFDAGRISLDLVGTVRERLSPRPVDRLADADLLREWLHDTCLVPADQTAAVDGAWLVEFVALRELLHRVVHAELNEAAEPADLFRLNRTAAVAPPAVRLRRDRDGRLTRRLAGPPRSGAVRSVIARDAIDLLAGADRGLLRECEGETCDLVYLDASRGRRRRWCASTACGNRQRVARHRGRLATAG
ncbi:MAG TPA: ABATE domain-containing protein [Actinocatenispora sp.]